MLRSELITELKKTVSITLASYDENAAAQSQKNHGSVVALLSRMFLQKSGKFLQQGIYLFKNVMLARKLTGWLENCPDNPETVWMFQKLSGQSKECPDNLKTVQII